MNSFYWGGLRRKKLSGWGGTKKLDQIRDHIDLLVKKFQRKDSGATCPKIHGIKGSTKVLDGGVDGSGEFYGLSIKDNADAQTIAIRGSNLAYGLPVTADITIDAVGEKYAQVYALEGKAGKDYTVVFVEAAAAAVAFAADVLTISYKDDDSTDIADIALLLATTASTKNKFAIGVGTGTAATDKLKDDVASTAFRKPTEGYGDACYAKLAGVEVGIGYLDAKETDATIYLEAWAADPGTDIINRLQTVMVAYCNGAAMRGQFVFCDMGYEFDIPLLV